MKDGRFHPAVWVEEKDCWWFSVAGRKLANFVALACDQFFRDALKVRNYYITIRGRLRWFCCQCSFAYLDKARRVIVLSKHRFYSLRLLAFSFTPPSLIFTPPVRTKVGYKIARKTEIKYLRIQHAQRFNLKVFKSRVTSSGFFNWWRLKS